jgi:hypothetical protein
MLTGWDSNAGPKRGCSTVEHPACHSFADGFFVWQRKLSPPTGSSTILEQGLMHHVRCTRNLVYSTEEPDAICSRRGV